MKMITTLALVLVAFAFSACHSAPKKCCATDGKACATAHKHK